jgi:hypothetical protein
MKDGRSSSGSGSGSGSGSSGGSSGSSGGGGHVLVCLLLARLIFDHECVGDTFLRNVGSYMDYTALFPRKWQLSIIISFCCIQYFIYLRNIIQNSGDI